MELRDYLRILRKRGWIIILTTVLTAVALLLFAMTLLLTLRGTPYLYYGEEIEFMKGAPQDVIGERDTLVIFLSDNGPWLSYGDHAGSAGPLREGKGTVEDYGNPAMDFADDLYDAWVKAGALGAGPGHQCGAAVRGGGQRGAIEPGQTAQGAGGVRDRGRRSPQPPAVRLAALRGRSGAARSARGATGSAPCVDRISRRTT